MLEVLKIIFPNANPTKIIVDFEIAAINAFHAQFPLADIKGCYFHLSQAIIRNVGSIGSKKKFECLPSFNLKIRSLAALAFVPINEVAEVFTLLCDTFDDAPECNQLLQYFESTYIRGPQVGSRPREARFPPRLWNYAKEIKIMPSAPRTTNAVEGFHNALQECSDANIRVYGVC
uniref:uncharacterized protein LOC120337092 n=1 Tax=Styela clava TaxID=7725 RepID=UPI00193A222D|nr:uncharacterized protein LOC120337092 [Styela clava]